MRPPLLFAFLLLLSGLGLAIALAVGSVPMRPAEILALLGGSMDDPVRHAILFELRLPRALTAFAVGGLLALAGALLQVLLRNPLADPYVLGTSGGAGVGALLVMFAGLSGLWLTGGAFAGALASTLLVFGLAEWRGGGTPTRLLLTGIVVASGWGALIAFLLSISPDRALRGMLFWLMGDLQPAARPDLLLGLLAVVTAVAFALARPLNVLGQGRLAAASLGVGVGMLRRWVYLLASLATGTAVAFAGSIGFVGLVVPHMLRLAGARDHRLLLPAAALAGGSLLLLADTAARSLLAPRQLPVGVLTALIGVPTFLYLLLRQAGETRS